MKPKKSSAKKKSTAPAGTRRTSAATKSKPSAKKSARATPVKARRAIVDVTEPEPPQPEPPRKRTVRKVAAKKATRVAKRAMAAKPAVPVAPAVPVSIEPVPQAAKSVAASTKPVRPSTVSTVKVRKVPAKIPPILLEGDQPPVQTAGGPGKRFALGTTASLEQMESEGELPEAYGTGQLLLAARDPHWLYAHWDLTREQQRDYNAESRDRHLVLRVHAGSSPGKPAAEVHVHPESRHWFVHVTEAGQKYVATLGFYTRSGDWTTVAISGPTLTPPDAMSPDTTAEFATIPFEIPMAKLLSLVKEAVQEHVPLAQALEEMRATGNPELPRFLRQPAPSKPISWTPAQEQALAKIISMDHVRRVWMGSLEITELIRRRVVQELVVAAAAQLGVGPVGVPTSPAGGEGAPGAGGAISSPSGRAAQPSKRFWFSVNAELVIYGATEADAQVTIGGRPIQLRSDGSFSYRFALPDGEYGLPIVAVSSDRTDGRAAELAFTRATEYSGDVGQHPQSEELKRPDAANL